MKKIMMICLMALMVTSAQAACENLVINGDFELGNDGSFSSDYTYQAPPTYLSLPETYSVGTDPYDFHPAWTSYGDKTTGSGNMLIVNAGEVPDTTVWEQTVAVTADTQYTLTYWLASSHVDNPAEIRCSIEGNVSGITTLGDQFPPVTLGEWLEVSYSWTSGGTDISATIRLVDLTLEYQGDDFAIDDISLSPPCIDKEMTLGPGEIGIYLPGETVYEFVITYSGPAAVVIDTVPAEFDVTGTDPPENGDVDVSPAGKGPKSKSATIITWDAPAGENTLTVTIQTRLNPGKGHGKKGMIVYKPTSCGILELNDGATAYDPIAYELGELVVIVGPTDPLEVEAVCGAKPCTPTGLVVTLSGDDLLLDWDDVCVGGDPVVYNVYRDGDLIAEGLGDSDYDDEDLSPGTYCYAVEAEYVPQLTGYESGKSDEVCEIVPVP